nr:gamma-glutamylcyclotransferase family protein [Allomuricauda sp.]
MKIKVFFYGLYMDEAILLKNGIRPSQIQMGHLKDYTLKIGTRASLLPSPGSTAYGLLMTVDANHIKILYSETSVADYIPEKVDVYTNTTQPIEAICYNLPAELLSGTNAGYAQALYSLAKKLGFPEGYLKKIHSMAESGPNN